MFVDMLGKTRIKLSLHLHSAFSDGELTPPEIAELYAAEGYDAIAVTDRWIFGEECELSGLLVLSGAEYDVGGGDRDNGIYHVVGIGMTSDPEIPYDWKNMKKTAASKAEQIIEKIRLYNGFSFVAHPAWCDNTARKLLDVGCFDGLEIFSAASAFGGEDKSYSGDIVTELAKFGTLPVLIASDDAKDYADEQFCAAVMVEASEMDSASIVRALRAGRFYSTEGPEVHISVSVGGKVKVTCSPCTNIELFTNDADKQGKCFSGEGLVEAEYSLKQGERYVRAEVTDSLGNRAWTNYLSVD
ncbi:MAG: hypothetical protein E7677_01465 [Ruminococcaceae bacterium]|nr:hypothetical protein [Oscillospiraceae bacterium]